MWNPRVHTDDENLRFCWLRAVEWDAWPFFLSQPIVPALLIQVVWWKILVGLSAIQIMWTGFVRLRWVNIWYADAGMMFTLTKWAIGPLAALGLYRWGHTGLAVFALLWPLALHVVKYLVWMLMAILLAAPLGIELMQVGVIQRRFMLQLGYTRNEDECVRSFGSPFDGPSPE